MTRTNSWIIISVTKSYMPELPSITEYYKEGVIGEPVKDNVITAFKEFK